MHIEPLSKATVRQAGTLANRIFPHECPSPRLSFWASLVMPDMLLRLFGYRRVRYWVAVAEDRVVGTVGLYLTRADRDEACWLGWFCVAPDRAGEGIGGALLDHAIAKARNASARVLRVETWDGPDSIAARALYERRGFKLSSSSPPRSGCKTIRMELALSQHPG